MPVGQRGIEVDAIVRLRKILADDRDGDGAVEALAVGTPVLAAPGHAVTDRAAVGRGDRREPTRNLERVAAHEATREVGLVELLADDAAADRAAMAAERTLEDAARHRVRMEHEIAPHESAAIGEPVGEARRA